jgi:ABC-type glycerol-3-phosphate transport system permease component
VAVARLVPQGLMEAQAAVLLKAALLALQHQGKETQVELKLAAMKVLAAVVVLVLLVLTQPHKLAAMVCRRCLKHYREHPHTMLAGVGAVQTR